MTPHEESAISEITILPDGRVFILGASRQVLETLAALNPRDANLNRRLEHSSSGGKGNPTTEAILVKNSSIHANASQGHCP